MGSACVGDIMTSSAAWDSDAHSELGKSEE